MVFADLRALEARLGRGTLKSGEGASASSRWLGVVGGALGGLVVGAGLAAAYLNAASPFRERRPDALGTALATVEGVTITRAEWQRAMDAIAGDRRPWAEVDGGAGSAEGRRVLDRLVDEELLYQRALALDLPRRDGRLKNEIVGTLVERVVAEAGGREPSDVELEAELREHPERYAAAPRVRVEVLYFAVPPGVDPAAAESRARTARERWAEGATFASLVAASDPPPLPLPDALVGRDALVEALGPTAAAAALAIPVGSISALVRVGGGYSLVHLLERQAHAATVDDARPALREGVRRAAGERRLRALLDELRKTSEVRVREP